MRGSREIAFFVPAAVVVTADQLTKWWVRHHVPLGTTEPFLGPLRLTHVSNSGGVFGFTANPILLALLNAAVLLTLLLLYRRLSSLALRTALGLVLGGGIGNLADRLWMGYVTDFVDIRVWDIFNIADASLVVGLLEIIYLLLRGKA